MPEAESTAAVIIVGAGLAGLFTALKLSPHPVTIIAGAPLGDGASSAWAQGGIAAAVGEGDTSEAHARDTIDAGAGLVDERIANLVADEAPDRIRDLLKYGVPFDRDLEGHYVLSREAAHSAKRVVRVQGDRAGKAIMQALIAAVRDTPSINVIQNATADNLITTGSPPNQRVTGLRFSRLGDPAASYTLEGAQAVVLATGGIGALYALTTNPSNSRGNGIAMGANAGAVVADAEFVQFHPTAIDIDADPAPLATEALRGEGAVLINEHGERFLKPIHPDAEMAPRDIVAKAVFDEIAVGGKVFLDCTEAVGSAFAERFPTVHGRCIEAGIDPAIDPIPVAPAEHYHMGGLKTDDRARTAVPGLWAVGEVAATGLHGANRLASNSLIEAVVLAARAAEDIANSLQDEPPPATITRRKADHLPDAGARQAALAIIRTTMTRHVGVVRDADGLREALAIFEGVSERADGDPLIQNAALTARFIAEAALRRKESRGGHLRTDFPKTDAAQARSRSMTLQGLSLRSSIAAGALPAGIDRKLG